MLSKVRIVKIRKDALNRAAKLPPVFSALSDDGRYRIFRLLAKYQQLCVTDIAHVLNISVPAASQQLKLMEMSGLIHGQRNGQMICYSIKKTVPLVKSMIKLINNNE